MNKIGVIFDLDGVIVDTAKYHFLAWKKLADALGFEFTEAHNELLKGVSRVRSLEILLGIGNVTVSEAEKQKIDVSQIFGICFSGTNFNVKTKFIFKGENWADSNCNLFLKIL